jgi:hypothetical protein
MAFPGTLPSVLNTSFPFTVVASWKSVSLQMNEVELLASLDRAVAGVSAPILN